MPDRFYDPGEVPVEDWKCSACGATNSGLDSECQFCDGIADLKIEDDPAWKSEERLRNMEGYGDYEGPVTWP